MIGHGTVWSPAAFWIVLILAVYFSYIVVILILCQEFVQTLYSFEVPVLDAESILVQLFTCNKVREHIANHQGWWYFGCVPMREFGLWFTRSAETLRQKGTRHCELRRPCQWPCGHAAWLQLGLRLKHTGVKKGVWTWHRHRRSIETICIPRNTTPGFQMFSGLTMLKTRTALCYPPCCWCPPCPCSSCSTPRVSVLSDISIWNIIGYQ